MTTRSVVSFKLRILTEEDHGWSPRKGSTEREDELTLEEAVAVYGKDWVRGQFEDHLTRTVNKHG